MMQFRDRQQAGEHVAERVRRLDLAAPSVLALPRGGVPVAARVATAIGAPLDVVVARKIGAPGNPEFAVGAVTAEGPALFDDASLARLGLTREDMESVVERERAEARRRVVAYRGDRPAIDLTGRDALVVDDGLATGLTARAALRYAREREPASLRLTVPVCAKDAAARLEAECDEVICLHAPEMFMAVGAWYAEFTQTTDDDVLRLLHASARG